mmetsp:Transcript_72456/g.170413  ORF Transcript_72456/g.170413 Transcript_72456/m.170413 type:complete len:98 (+) Transcript_72456:894-1187(+)
MLQVNSTTGFGRAVRRSSVVWPVPRWEFRDEQGFVPYHTDQCTLLEACRCAGIEVVVLITSHGDTTKAYEVSFPGMQQKALHSGFQRPIRRLGYGSI